jgi:hypothetical protein
VPLITSQYVPAARDVVNVATQDESALFIATKPEEPRPKAIRFDAGDTQFVIAPVTLFRKPTIPATPVHRCWQSQPFEPPLPEQVPAPNNVMKSDKRLKLKTTLTIFWSPIIVTVKLVAREDRRGTV